MVIGIIGESCTGKTTIIQELGTYINIEEYSGKDYLKLDKNPKNAEMNFKQLLEESHDKNIVYVITEKEHIDLLPSNAIRVLVTESLETKKERFKARMNNRLPKPVEMMLERKHGMFDSIDYDLHLSGSNLEENVKRVVEFLS